MKLWIILRGREIKTRYASAVSSGISPLEPRWAMLNGRCVCKGCRSEPFSWPSAGKYGYLRIASEPSGADVHKRITTAPCTITHNPHLRTHNPQHNCSNSFPKPWRNSPNTPMRELKVAMAFFPTPEHSNLPAPCPKSFPQILVATKPALMLAIPIQNFYLRNPAPLHDLCNPDLTLKMKIDPLLLV